MTQIFVTCRNCGDIKLEAQNGQCRISRYSEERAQAKFIFKCPECKKFYAKSIEADEVELLIDAGIEVSEIRSSMSEWQSDPFEPISANDVLDFMNEIKKLEQLTGRLSLKKRST
jgi:hypothetical protein